jgi:3-dehydroquinate synthase
MHTLRIDFGARSYPIRIGTSLLARPLSFGEAAGRPCRIVTDANVAAHYLAAVRGALRVEERHCLVLPAGEEQKTFERAGAVLDWLLASGLPRDGVVVALGGGVVGDLAGFAAAICQRGVDFVQVPTTLLAQVDSSVGGKTGVNHPGGKNLIGAFHQPAAVLADTDTLSTLPERQLRAGLTEIVKAALAADAAFFGWLESNLARLVARDAGALEEAIRRACAIKAEIVAEDEREQGRRAVLNLGHTFGHAIEAGSGYGRVLHGEAVAAGLVLAAELSARTGRLPVADARRVRELIEAAGLPVDPPRLGRGRLLELMAMDKKVKGGALRLVLLDAIGRATVTADYPREALETLLEERAGA